ncbi:TPA: hypothetical protein ACGPFX_004794 [Bacillus pacificus]
MFYTILLERLISKKISFKIVTNRITIPNATLYAYELGDKLLHLYCENGIEISFPNDNFKYLENNMIITKAIDEKSLLNCFQDLSDSKFNIYFMDKKDEYMFGFYGIEGHLLS